MECYEQNRVMDKIGSAKSWYKRDRKKKKRNVIEAKLSNEI